MNENKNVLPTNCFDILRCCAILLILVRMQEDHGLLVAIGADFEILFSLFRTGCVL